MFQRVLYVRCKSTSAARDIFERVFSRTVPRICAHHKKNTDVATALIHKYQVGIYEHSDSSLLQKKTFTPQPNMPRPKIPPCTMCILHYHIPVYTESSMYIRRISNCGRIFPALMLLTFREGERFLPENPSPPSQNPQEATFLFILFYIAKHNPFVFRQTESFPLCKHEKKQLQHFVIHFFLCR